MFQGEHVNLVPISRGVNDQRGLVYVKLWAAIEDAGDGPNLLWAHKAPKDPTAYDLVDFMSYWFLDQATLQIFVNKDGELVGATWFNLFNLEERSCHGSIWVDPRYRGTASREVVQLATRYAFEVLRAEVIRGCGPHKISRNLMLRCGWTETLQELVIDPRDGQQKILYHVEKRK